MERDPVNPFAPLSIAKSKLVRFPRLVGALESSLATVGAGMLLGSIAALWLSDDAGTFLGYPLVGGVAGGIGGVLGRVLR